MEYSDNEPEFQEDDCGYFEGLTKKEEEMWIYSEDKSAEIVEKFYSGVESSKDFHSCQEFIYATLLNSGWRKSGMFFYRETCPHCKKCLPIRLVAEDFVPSKSQRKSLRKNLDVEVTLVSNPTDFVTDEKVRLFTKYMKRHNDYERDFDENFDTLSWMNGLNGNEKVYSGTFNMDYRVNGKLIGVGIVERGFNALSSNYFYYDVSDETLDRSIGVFSVLKEIEACRGNLFDGELKSDLYYLGYYIAECNKMSYKSNYKPYQLLIDGEWRDFPEK